VHFLGFPGDGDPHRQQGREEKKKASQTPLFPRLSSGGAWWRRAATISVVPEGLPCNS